LVELSHDSRPIIGRGPPLGATFLALAAASIALMVADVRYDQLGRVRGWLDAAAYPLQLAIDLPFRAWNWLTGSFADRDRLRRDNLELTGRLRLADLQLQRFEALEAENLRLREMRASSATVAKRAIVASILNVDLDPFRHRVLLDKGAADGVFKGQAVLDAHGIFGQVWRVNTRSAEVILISDAEHAIPVQSNRSGVRTIAVGTGDPNELSLPFVTVESDLKKGDLLITTGMGGVFPPGYPVAHVTRVERTSKATFAIVEAQPTAQLDRDREVLLVWFEAPAPAAASEPPVAAAPGNAPASATEPVVGSAPQQPATVPSAAPQTGPAAAQPGPAEQPAPAPEQTSPLPEQTSPQPEQAEPQPEQAATPPGGAR
jgi:rod shape-determining protein MreC